MTSYGGTIEGSGAFNTGQAYSLEGANMTPLLDSTIPFGLCQCGCGERTRLARDTNKTLGYIKGQPVPYLRGHAGRKFSRKWGTSSLTPTYSSYSQMLKRVQPDHPKAHRYYHRGIVVCDRWKESFDNFVADMGLKPEGKTIDRINNDGNYEPGNCHWATPTEQANNRVTNRFLTVNGETHSHTEWEHLRGLKQGTIYARIRAGWAVERCILGPQKPGGYHRR